MTLPIAEPKEEKFYSQLIHTLLAVATIFAGSLAFIYGDRFVDEVVDRYREAQATVVQLRVSTLETQIWLEREWTENSSGSVAILDAYSEIEKKASSFDLEQSENAKRFTNVDYTPVATLSREMSRAVIEAKSIANEQLNSTGLTPIEESIKKRLRGKNVTIVTLLNEISESIKSLLDKEVNFLKQLRKAVVAAVLVLIACSMYLIYRLTKINRKAKLAIQQGKIELEQSQEVLHTFIDFTYDWEYWIDPEGRYKYISPSCQRITGYSAEELLSDSSLVDSMLADESSIPDCHKRSPQASEIHRDSYQIMTKSGERRWIEHVCQPVYSHREFLGRRGSNQDVTARINLEQERSALQRQIQDSQRLDSLGSLARGVSHDLNNILQLVISNAELAKSNLPEKFAAAKYIDNIEDAAKRAADLSAQMMTYAGKKPVEQQEVDIALMIAELSDLLKATISKNINYQLHLSEDFVCTKGDPTQIRQVFMNLVTNACEAIGESNGEIIIKTGIEKIAAGNPDNIYIGTEIEGGSYAFVEVSDNGCGMDQKTQEKIFDPFFTTKPTGRGFGMSATLGIIRSHSGFVCVSSKKGEGSSVKVFFPNIAKTKNKPNSDMSHALAQTIPAVSDSPCPGTILLVDDEGALLKIAERVLKNAKYKVATALNGRDAVRIFSESHQDIALVVLDLMMPEMSGEQTFKELKKIRSDIKVLLSSGYSANESLERFKDSHIAGFIQKPYRPSELITKIQALT